MQRAKRAIVLAVAVVILKQVYGARNVNCAQNVPKLIRIVPINLVQFSVTIALRIKEAIVLSVSSAITM